MNVHQKGKNIRSQQQQQLQPQSGPPSYPNQQSRPNATYHFDDASQKYGYGGSYVGGTGAGQVPPRLPLVSGLPCPNPPIAAPNETPKPLPVVPDSVVEKTSEKPVIAAEPESVITNGDKQGSSPLPSLIVMTPPPNTATDDGENRAPGKSTSPKYTYKDDQWSPVNPEGKKTYDRNFLLELRKSPASKKKPEGLPSLEIVRHKPQQVPVSSGASRRARSSALRIVDPNTNRDVLTGEEWPPSAVVTPTAATPPEIAAAGVVPAPVVMATDEVEATVKEIAPVFSETKEMAPSPTGVSTTNPNHPSNAAQALPYPGLNQPLLFVIGDQFNQKSPYLSAYPANPPAYYPQSGNLPPGNVSFQQPRPAQQSNAHRQTPPYPSFPMQSSPAVYYQPQQPQPQQTQQLQQQKQQQPQQPEEPQQVPVAPLLKTQPRESKGASRRAMSSHLRLVDVRTNRHVLIGEEVSPPSVTPTTTSTLHSQPLHHHLQPLPEIVTAGVVSASVVAPDEVEAPLTATVRAPPTTEYVRLKYGTYGNTFKKIGNTGIKYSRENPLGQGTYGSVYLGIYNDQLVAVKRIELKQSKKEEREADLQQNLDHENVLKILKVEKDDDFRYIVLELCAGTLSEVIDKTYKGPAYPSDPIVLYQIADGLDYIHSKKLIHRDIKPENILISMNGQQLKLSDFGLSKQISLRDTCSMSGTKGTLLWMAPELRGDDNNKATPKCDVFPCGCVFFVFLTRENGGIHPFGDMKDHLEVQINIRSGKLINIDKLKADHYAVPVIREMIKANPLERINLADVKERLRPFSHPDLRPSTTVESVKSTSLNYKDDQRTPVNPEGKSIYDLMMIGFFQK